MVLDIWGLMGVVDGSEMKPDASAPLSLANWMSQDKEACAQITLTLKDEPLNGALYTTTAEEPWKKLNKCYKGKGHQTIAYLIGDLFCGTLSDESELEPQLNLMQQKAYMLKSLGQPLNDLLVAIAIMISLPTLYSTLQTILMSTADKLSINAVVS